MTDQAVPLSRLSEFDGLLGSPLSAIARGRLEDRRQTLSERVARDVFTLFKLSTVSMNLLVIALAVIDAWYIHEKIISPAQRLVTQTVLMSVIAATLVQVGAASFAVATALFPTRRKQPQPPAAPALPATPGDRDVVPLTMA